MVGGSLLGWLAGVALPGGYRIYKNAGPEGLKNGQIVIQIKQTQIGKAHWWDDTSAVKVFPVSYDTFVWKDGCWHWYGPKGMVVVHKSGPDTAYMCITPSGALGVPHINAPPLAVIPIFATHLRGPSNIGAKMQDLASRWLSAVGGGGGGRIVAFAMDWGSEDASGKEQGFFVVPSWSYFWERILRTTRRKNRHFFEMIPSNVLVRFYLDFDGKLQDLLERGLSLEKAIEILLPCIEQAFRKCYPNASRPLTRADLDIWNSSSEQLNKLSLHIHGNARCMLVWKNSACLKTFVERVRVLVFEQMYGTPPDEDRTKLVDMSVYDANKKFRMPECTKPGEERYLTFYPTPENPNPPRDGDDCAIVVPNQQYAALCVLPRVGGAFILRVGSDDAAGRVQALAGADIVRDGNFVFVPVGGQGKREMHMPAHPLIADFELVDWQLARGAIPVEWLEQAHSRHAAVEPLREGGATLSQNVSVTEEERQILLNELYSIFGPFDSRVTISLCHGMLLASTQIHTCPFFGTDGAYEHGSWTQYVVFCRDGKRRKCRDPACYGRFHLHPYLNADGMRQIERRLLSENTPVQGNQDDQEGQDNQDNQIVPENQDFIRTKALVLSVFPEHFAHWNGCNRLWRLPNAFFGPANGCYTVDYQLCAPFSLLFRRKLGAKDPFSCEVRRLPSWNPVPLDGIGCNWDLGLVMMNVCDELIGSVGCLDVESNVIKYYAADSGKPVCTIRPCAEPVDIITAYGKTKKRADEKTSRACRAFYASVELLPVDLSQEADRVKCHWLKTGVIAHGSQFIIDDGGSETDLNFGILPPLVSLLNGKDPLERLLVIAPPAAGKTKGVRDQLGFVGDVVANNILMSGKLAEDFGTGHYLEIRNGGRKRVRSEQDLSTAPEPQSICINSVDNLTKRRHIDQIFFDEITASLTGTGSKEFMGTETASQVLESTVDLIKSPYKQRVICASADITPELEGRLFARLLGPANFRVLYKARPRSAAATRCVELKADAQMWDIYVRILMHNARSNDTNRWIRLFFPSNTKAVVKKAKALQERYWPGGPCIFVHSEMKIEDDFVKNPNVTWLQYAIVCCSPKLKVGVSFTVLNYFHVTIAFACTSVTSSNDFAQSMQRVRCPVRWLFYRVRNQGGGKPVLPKDLDARTLQWLEEFAEARNVDRSLLPDASVLPLVEEESESVLSWLRKTVTTTRFRDQQHYLRNVRQMLRKRDMTVRLCGVNAAQRLDLFEGAKLLPLPFGADLRGPDSLQERIEAIIGADDIERKQLLKLWEQKKEGIVLSKEQRAEEERYDIRQVYKDGGELSFDDFVSECVRHKLASKIEQCAIVFGPLQQMAAFDEAQRLHTKPDDREHKLYTRQTALSFLSLIPGVKSFELFSVVCVALHQFEVGGKKLLKQQEELLKEMGAKSNANGTTKRIINNFNSVLASLGLSALTPSRIDNGAHVTLEWTLDTRGDHVPFYAGVMKPPSPAGPALRLQELQFLCKDIEILEDAVDANTETYPLAAVPNGFRMVFACPPPDSACSGDLQQTLCHLVNTALNGTDNVAITISWEIFHKDRLFRIVYPNKGYDMNVRNALKQMAFTDIRRERPLSNQLLPYEPTYCRTPRVNLVRWSDAPDVWKMEDASTYF